MCGECHPKGNAARLPSHIVSIVAVILVGAWFLIHGWDEFTNVAAIGGLAVLGFAGALLVLPLSLWGKHWAAAASAVVDMVTPSAFAYPPNLLMIVVALLEARVAYVNQSSVTE